MNGLAEKQIKPLNPSVAAIWEHEGSDYPDLIKLPMEDGRVISYRREITQPHPQCMTAVDIIRLMKDSTYGGYKGKHAKKPADAGTSNRQAQKELQDIIPRKRRENNGL